MAKKITTPFKDLGKYLEPERTHSVSFVTSDIEYEKLKASAQRQHVSNSEFCRALLKMYWAYEAEELKKQKVRDEIIEDSPEVLRSDSPDVGLESEQQGTTDETGGCVQPV